MGRGEENPLINSRHGLGLGGVEAIQPPLCSESWVHAAPDKGGTHALVDRLQPMTQLTRGSTLRKSLAVLGLGLGLLAVPIAALAHPLGNFTVNQYVGILVKGASVDVDYVVDMAEIPAFQERQEIDSNDDDLVSAAEEAAYLANTCSQRAAGLGLTIDGAPVSLVETGQHLTFPPGQAGLTTLRLECSFAGAGDGVFLNVVNNNYPEKIGWREMVVSSEGVSVSTDLPSASPSVRLTTYPNDPATTTPDITRGTVTVGVEGSATPTPNVGAAPITGLPD